MWHYWTAFAALVLAVIAGLALSSPHPETFVTAPNAAASSDFYARMNAVARERDAQVTGEAQVVKDEPDDIYGYVANYAAPST